MDYIWYIFLIYLGLFLVACHLSPHQVTLLQSNAYTSIIPWNFGDESLEFQSIALIVYHQSFLGRLTHLTLVTDNIAWIVLSCSNPYVFLLVALIPLIQSYTLSSDTGFIYSLNLSWILASLGGFYVNSIVDSDLLMNICRVVVISGPIIRSFGHFFEKVPPLVGGRKYLTPFGPQMGAPFYLSKIASLDSQMVILPFLGYISEAAAGLPTRLWPSMVWVLYCYARKPSTFVNLKSVSDKISDQGWTSYPLTNRIFGWIGTKQQ